MKRFWIVILITISLSSWAYSAEDHQWTTHAMSKGSHIKKSPAILIFVSFSMPKESLEAILRDAKKIHASVVIRGLIDDSFQKTYQRIAELVNASGGDGMELNPLWFKRFKIQSVPSVVILPTDSPCFNDETCESERYDQMTGNITISAALKMISNKESVASDVSDAALDKLQGISHV